MRCPKTLPLVGTVLLSLIMLAPRAHADGGLSLDRFQPAPAGDRFFGVQGGDPGGHLSPRLMLLGDYGYRPMVWKEGDDVIGPIVKNQLMLHIAAGISLWDRLSIFADMPIALLNNGDNVSPTLRAPSGVSAGDLRPGARVRLLGETDSIASLSLGGYLYIPTGKKFQYTGADEIHGGPTVVLAGENDHIAYAANLGADLRKKTSHASGLPDFGSNLQFGAAFAVLLADRALQIGPEIYGNTLMVGDQSFERRTTNLEAILGARWSISDWVLGVGAGTGIIAGLGTPKARVIASVAYVPVSEPEVVKPLPADRDGDGILDVDDACPTVRGVRSSNPDRNGCPPDRDDDGVIDKKDACPDVKGVATDDPETNGCPPDTDGDGIRDDVDACPNEKGKADPDPEKNGCPGAVRVTEKEIVILEQVQFKTGSADILPASDDLLTQVSSVLNEHPEILAVEVQGHTDNRGGKAMNKKLSQKRAASVVDWLVKRGNVDASRLTAKGYGYEQPIADNDTDEGRQKNRRVQFSITEKKPSPEAAAN